MSEISPASEAWSAPQPLDWNERPLQDPIEGTKRMVFDRLARLREGATPEQLEALEKVERALSAIAALNQSSYQQLLAFLTLTRLEEQVNIRERSVAFLSEASYPAPVQDALRRITEASDVPLVARYGEREKLPRHWILWSRLVHRGYNLLNPQQRDDLPMGFALDRDAELWVEGLYRENLHRSLPMQIRHYERFSQLTFQGRSMHVMEGGGMVTAGNTMELEDCFGIPLYPRLTVRPEFFLPAPYSRVGLQFVRTPQFLLCFNNGNWLPVRHRDATGEFESRSEVVRASDGSMSIGHSMVIRPAARVQESGGQTECMRRGEQAREHVRVRRPQLPDAYEEPKAQQEHEVPQKIRGGFRAWVRRLFGSRE